MPSTRGSKKFRIAATATGTIVGFGALVSYNMLHAALADNSPALPIDTNLDVPVDVQASAGTWAFARSPSLALTTSVAPTTVTPGSKIVYSYAVSNLTTDSSFTNLVVTDDKCDPVTYKSGDLNSNSKLDVGEVWKYSCTTTILKDQQNNAKVTAKAVVNPSAAPSPVVTPSVTSTPTPTASPTPTPSKVITDGTYAGSVQSVYIPDANETYSVQVGATITGGKISAITFTTPVAPTDTTSKNILKFNVATMAGLNADPTNPTMIEESIRTNSAAFAAISGATYTSNGFKASLQSALTAAGY